jgi:hypothetical protein
VHCARRKGRSTRRIVEDADLAGARALTDGLPFLAGSDGKCAVEIFELLPM